MIVHVTTQGARIVREGRHLLVRKDNDTYHTLFIHRLEQLVLYGNVSITTLGTEKRSVAICMLLKNSLRAKVKWVKN
jgi:hypothetical protein